MAECAGEGQGARGDALRAEQSRAAYLLCIAECGTWKEALVGAGDAAKPFCEARSYLAAAPSPL